MTAPVLVFGFGNPSRGDDALGPEFVRALETKFAAEIERGELEVLTDYQLQVEHALDLVDRQRVFFVDASVSAAAPFEVREVQESKDDSFTTHLLSPGALLHTFVTVMKQPAPQSWIVAIRGERFELGEPLSATAAQGLASALEAPQLLRAVVPRT